MIREFIIHVAHVLNRGNYESLRIEAGLTVAVPEGDDFEYLDDSFPSSVICSRASLNYG